MVYNYDIEFFKCGTCTSKTHCERCADEIVQIISQKDGVLSAGMNIPDGTAFVEMQDGYDDDDILDALDDMGIFI